MKSSVLHQSTPEVFLHRYPVLSSKNEGLNVFDTYCIPMGEGKVEKRYHTPEEIKKYIRDVEQAFGLPPGGIAHKRQARLKRSQGGVNIVEVRKAAIYHLMKHTKTQKYQIFPVFGITRFQLFDSLRAAEHHLDARDETFAYYYGVVSSIEI